MKLSIAYALGAERVLLVPIWESDGGLVAVERRDVKHVAVGADPDRLHLAVPRQWSRMR